MSMASGDINWDSALSNWKTICDAHAAAYGVVDEAQKDNPNKSELDGFNKTIKKVIGQLKLSGKEGQGIRQNMELLSAAIDKSGGKLDPAQKESIKRLFLEIHSQAVAVGQRLQSVAKATLTVDPTRLEHADTQAKLRVASRVVPKLDDGMKQIENAFKWATAAESARRRSASVPTPSGAGVAAPVSPRAAAKSEPSPVTAPQVSISKEKEPVSNAYSAVREAHEYIYKNWKGNLSKAQLEQFATKIEASIQALKKLDKDDKDGLQKDLATVLETIRTFTRTGSWDNESFVKAISAQFAPVYEKAGKQIAQPPARPRSASVPSPTQPDAEKPPPARTRADSAAGRIEPASEPPEGGRPFSISVSAPDGKKHEWSPTDQQPEPAGPLAPPPSRQRGSLSVPTHEEAVYITHPPAKPIKADVQMQAGEVEAKGAGEEDVLATTKAVVEKVKNLAKQVKYPISSAISKEIEALGPQVRRLKNKFEGELSNALFAMGDYLRELKEAPDEREVDRIKEELPAVVDKAERELRFY